MFLYLPSAYRVVFSFILCLVLATSPNAVAVADERESSSPSFQDSRRTNDRPRIYRDRVTPNWINNSDRFWYRNDLADGEKEFVLVDPNQGSKAPAFDHAAVARALENDADEKRLPLDRLHFSDSGSELLLIGSPKSYRWNPENNTLTELNELPPEANTRPAQRGSRNRGRNRANGDESQITVVNTSKEKIELFWLNGDGGKQSYGTIEPGASREQHTFGGHRWMVVTAEGKSLGTFTAQDASTRITIDGNPLPDPAPPRRRAPPSEASTPSFPSPDGKWVVSVEDHQLQLSVSDSGEKRAITDDGDDAHRYEMIQWSPDSKTLIAFRHHVVEKQPVHWIRSSPPEGGRAQLETRPYVLPGDPFPKYELVLFSVDKAETIKPNVELFEHEWLRPNLRFDRDGTSFTFEQIDRGHQRFRVFRVKCTDGTIQTLIDETTNTFIWTAHTEDHQVPKVQWLEESDEIIFATETRGWRQLILLDAVTGREKRILTPEGIVVRGVESLDPKSRRIWISASGREAQDPYFIHHAHVNIDTGEWTWITEGNGQHILEFSPSRQFVVDTYSRVDQAPTVELRRTSDGALVCNLENSDLRELKASQWSAPEVFVAKGRDQTTDIWGIICRPKNFDPSKKYPVIEDIYAGPQSSYVPKTFSIAERYASLTDLGFIVVKIDGMGTANRSKAFHDVCWKNLKDAGFLDRIAWIRAAAAIHPEMDLSRVGIYGVSAGGQNAAAAVLFHPEFYKVAVAGCGCHDNRMDKASWNEQWMGYPLGPHYLESSNIENAHRLQGKLLLIVGEMDTNVPPESTLRFADALIRADKDFDLLVVPNAGHGIGGAYGNRRMHQFFVRHLIEQPPETQAHWQPALPSAPNLVAYRETSQPELTVSPPPESFFAMVEEAHRQQARDFYKKFLDIDGLPVVASAEVEDEALQRTHTIVSRMLAGRPDILKAMQRDGMYLIIIGRNQVYTDMPEYSDHPDPSFQNERVRGTGGKPTSFGEENLLGLSLDRYDDESIAVHEFCHTIDGALRSIDTTWKSRLRSTYQAARDLNLFENTYAASNPGEYWAEICQAFFDCNRVNNWNHGPIGTREQLKSYDPLGYELVRTTFQLLPDQDWRYSFPRVQPSVETPPGRFKIDPFYTQFSFARELPVVARNADPQSLLAANRIIRRMFAYRHDILKALIAAEIKVVVLGKEESIADLPELKALGAAVSHHDLSARWMAYTPETKVLVVGEENLQSLPLESFENDSYLVRILADAMVQVVGNRPVDPAWNQRPSHVWQQYELRVERIDERFVKELEERFRASKEKGLWKGTFAIHDAASYWNYGVMAYFHALGNQPSPAISDHPIIRREDLQSFDPGLFQLVKRVMNFDQHVDWRLRP